jgi:hypothetical protein
MLHREPLPRDRLRDDRDAHPLRPVAIDDDQCLDSIGADLEELQRTTDQCQEFCQTGARRGFGIHAQFVQFVNRVFQRQPIGGGGADLVATGALQLGAQQRQARCRWRGGVRPDPRR